MVPRQHLHLVPSFYLVQAVGIFIGQRWLTSLRAYTQEFIYLGTQAQCQNVNGAVLACEKTCRFILFYCREVAYHLCNKDQACS